MCCLLIYLCTSAIIVLDIIGIKCMNIYILMFQLGLETAYLIAFMFRIHNLKADIKLKELELKKLINTLKGGDDDV